MNFLNGSKKVHMLWCKWCVLLINDNNMEERYAIISSWALNVLIYAALIQTIN